MAAPDDTRAVRERQFVAMALFSARLSEMIAYHAPLSRISIVAPFHT